MWPCETRLSKLKYKGIKDYNTRDGFQTLVWGPPTWMSIHMTSFNYPPNPSSEDKKNYKSWLFSLENTLPCKYCRENFPTNIKQAGWNDNVMDSRLSFSKFCYDLHCEVNKMLGKDSPSFEEIRDKFEMLRAKCLSDEDKIKLKNENKELGCIRPKHNGERGKCVMSIVPANSNIESLIIDDRCNPDKCNTR
tara:strand:- start:256 stop:831 length:576 start_codon:yes stop_codon:yes gene_type:complete